MACDAAKLFMAFMEAQDMGCDVVAEGEDVTVLTVGWKLKETAVNVLFVFDSDNAHVQVKGLNFIQVAEDKADKALRAINQCNSRFKMVKFYLDEEHGQIIASDDAVIQLDSCAEEVFELMLAMARIIDEAYPILMKGIWS